jgi:uncharacterized protein (DUF305 family)
MKRGITAFMLVALGFGVAGWIYFNVQPAKDTTAAESAIVQSEPASADPNVHGFFDVDYAQKLIVHHQQALAMIDIILADTADPNVRDVANSLRESQAAAESKYVSWMNQWDEPYTDLAEFPQMDGHDMYPSYPGLVSAQDMSDLATTSSPQADALFTELMIEHHRGGKQLSRMSNKLQFGQLIEYKNDVFAEYDDHILRLETLRTKEGAE